MKLKHILFRKIQPEHMEPGRGFEPRWRMPVVFETTTLPLGYPGVKICFNEKMKK